MTSDEPVRGYGPPPTPPAGPPVPDDRVPGDAPRGEAYGDAWLRPTLDAGERSPSPEPPEPRRPRPSPAKRSWLLAGLGAALLLMAGVAAVSGDALTGEGSRTTSETFQRVPATLTIRGGANDIEVRGGGASGSVGVLTDTRCPGGNAPRPSWSGDTLVVDGDCGGFLGWGSVDHVITVPDGTAVTVETGSGDVAMAGSLGATRATSGSGDLSARDIAGPLSLETGSGDVEGSGLGRADVTAKTGSGDVDLDFSSAADAVRVQTGSGDASVRLPAGVYAVSAETGSGDTEVGVTNSPTGADHVTVRTGSGDIEVRYR
ncbi:DUF4097 family beta strand repeat-containing protein [Intrasporangium sp. YIM S08009]|uniref:DUF4097 family beta strand repeat-containing protein n=1 Tax=Intrasporangium zincisolvens TaxID=3080018 RepID=UPI002B05F6AC|nr:DUF4097 family beta strand repeat-containing protein [Intrasporangium sp. YIM S08009]